MAPLSAKQPHVRFVSDLTVPPADRQRKSHSLYPKVAQEKGRSKRQSSFDLFWPWDTLTSASEHQGWRWRYQLKSLATEKSESVAGTRYAALLSISGTGPPHVYQTGLVSACLRSDGFSWVWSEGLRLRDSQAS